jgi:2-oxoglutarate ferredoxin oxidoreductase subunit gamma
MPRTELRITGFGGQGVVLAGHIIGRAFAIHAGRHATMIQSFGPEARGSACSATLVISDEEILFPYIRQPDILVVMSAEGYELYADDLKPDGLLIYEQDLVKPEFRKNRQACGIPSTRIAESLGRPIVQNIVMVGFFAGVTALIPPQAMREAVRGSVPVGTEELNLEAFEKGLEYADTNIVEPVEQMTRPAPEEVTT